MSIQAKQNKQPSRNGDEREQKCSDIGAFKETGTGMTYRQRHTHTHTQNLQTPNANRVFFYLIHTQHTDRQTAQT